MRCLILMVVLLLVGTVAVVTRPAESKSRPHHCNAPCVVHFGPDMHEDEFRIDYRGNGTLRVWKEAPR